MAEKITTVVPIRGGMIRLGQLLKLSNLVGGGGEAKVRIQNGEVLVNGLVETRRGLQLHPGDRVELEQNILLLAAKEN